MIKEQCTAVHPSVEWRFEQAAMRTGQRRQGSGEALSPLSLARSTPVRTATFGAPPNCATGHRADSASPGAGLGWSAGPRSSPPFPYWGAGRTHRASRTAWITSSRRRRERPGGFHAHALETVFPDLAQRAAVARPSRPIARRWTHLGPVTRSAAVLKRACPVTSAWPPTWTGKKRPGSGAAPLFRRHRPAGGTTSSTGGLLNPDSGFSRLQLATSPVAALSPAPAWHGEQLKHELPSPLDTAHQIRVQDNPLNIRFRYDEKRFDGTGPTTCAMRSSAPAWTRRCQRGER